MIEINNTILKGTFLKRRLKRFKRRRDYLFSDSEKEDKRKGEKGVKEDLSNNDDRDELGDLVKKVKVIKKIKVEGEILARLIIQLLNMTN